jgi:hypothetical protein
MRTNSNHRRYLVVACALFVGALAFLPAHASVADLTPASLSNLSDIIGAAGDSKQGNVSCRPDVYGGAVTQHTNLIVAGVFAHDLAVGQGACNSLTLENFSATLYVDVEWYDPIYRTWRAVGGSIKSETASSKAGVLELRPLTSNVIYSTYPNAYLDKYHRGHVQINTSFGSVYHNYTPAVWYMAP